MEQKQFDKEVPFLDSETLKNQNLSKFTNKKVVPIEQLKEEIEDDDIMIINIFDPETGEYTKKAVRKLKK